MMVSTLSVVLLLAAVFFSIVDGYNVVHYVLADGGRHCPPQVYDCHSLSYYLSNPTHTLFLIQSFIF